MQHIKGNFKKMLKPKCLVEFFKMIKKSADNLSSSDVFVSSGNWEQNIKDLGTMCKHSNPQGGIRNRNMTEAVS